MTDCYPCSKPQPTADVDAAVPSGQRIHCYRGLPGFNPSYLLTTALLKRSVALLCKNHDKRLETVPSNIIHRTTKNCI